MPRYFDDIDEDDAEFFDGDDDVIDKGLGGLGEIINYGYYTPPASSAPPPSRYNTVSDDERATSGSEQPKREFSIWDSVAKPGKKPRTPTHSTRASSIKKKKQPSNNTASSGGSNFEYIPPASEPINTQAARLPEPAAHEGIDSNLLLLGGGALVLILLMRGR